MTGLEKILEEIKETAIFMQTTSGYGAMCVSTGAVERIIRKHMNDGWIPVDERPPEEKINPASQDFYEYQVTAKFGNVKDVRHYKYGNGHWWHGFGNVDKYVTAWRERPEPYRLEKEQERKENIRSGRFEKVE